MLAWNFHFSQLEKQTEWELKKIDWYKEVMDKMRFDYYRELTIGKSMIAQLEGLLKESP